MFFGGESDVGVVWWLVVWFFVVLWLGCWGGVFGVGCGLSFGVAVLFYGVRVSSKFSYMCTLKKHFS